MQADMDLIHATNAVQHATCQPARTAMAPSTPQDPCERSTNVTATQVRSSTRRPSQAQYSYLPAGTAGSLHGLSEHMGSFGSKLMGTAHGNKGYVPQAQPQGLPSLCEEAGHYAYTD